MKPIVCPVQSATVSCNDQSRVHSSHPAVINQKLIKTEANRKVWQRIRPVLSAAGFLPGVVSAVIVGFMPLVAPGQINGTTAGQTVTANVGDDSITVSTINIGYFTQCYFIANGITSNAAWGSYVFAGQAGVASGVANISPSDFTVSGYSPFIGTSTSTSNFVTLPSGDKIWADGLNGVIGNLNNAEAGGTGIAISYTPKNGDPTNINFVQAYVENINGTGFTTGVIDVSNNAVNPFYNSSSIAGTGTTLRAGTSPLLTSGTVPGWPGDQPYDNEFGTSAPGKDDTITNTTVTFQTFIEGQQNIGGTNYNVLYGGIQWGYSFNTMDIVPEPASLALVGLGGVSLVYFARRRKVKA